MSIYQPCLGKYVERDLASNESTSSAPFVFSMSSGVRDGASFFYCPYGAALLGMVGFLKNYAF